MCNLLLIHAYGVRTGQPRTLFWGFGTCQTRWCTQNCPEMLRLAAVNRLFCVEHVSSGLSVL